MRTTFALPSETTITYERRFAASPERLWRAYTDPDLVRQWLGYGEFVTCEMDMHPGGSYRWVWQLPDFTLGIHGDVLEADPPRRLVTSEHMSDTDYPPTTNTIEFLPDGDGDGDGTIMRGTIEYASREARDAAYATGMADGMDDSFTELAKIAA